MAYTFWHGVYAFAEIILPVVVNHIPSKVYAPVASVLSVLWAAVAVLWLWAQGWAQILVFTFVAHLRASIWMKFVKARAICDMRVAPCIELYIARWAKPLRGDRCMRGAGAGWGSGREKCMRK